MVNVASPPSYRDIAAQAFQAIGPSRIAVMTIYALRKSDLADPVRRAIADQAVERIVTARKMLTHGFLDLLALRDMDEPPQLSRARHKALAVMEEVQIAIQSAPLPTAEAMPDPDAFRVLCIDRVDPDVTCFLANMVATLNAEQTSHDQRARTLTLRSVDQARAVGRSIQMVALNATIEASKNGEGGRGFMVIAEEVRSLADRTQTILCDVAEGLKH